MKHPMQIRISKSFKVILLGLMHQYESSWSPTGEQPMGFVMPEERLEEEVLGDLEKLPNREVISQPGSQE